MGTLFGYADYVGLVPNASVSIPSQMGTLFGSIGYPSTGGGRSMSQYPLRWAPSSDPMPYTAIHTPEEVSIPSQMGSLF